jgi:hypothetical protein
VTTWTIGDIHGCADELGLLLERLDLGPTDVVLAVGDLFHRGPDPIGVMDHLKRVGARFILGNHELRVLERLGLAPRRVDASDRPPLRTDFPDLEDTDLAGDGRRPCDVPPERRHELATYLQSHDGFFLERAGLEHAGPTPDGREWCAVHAGLVPGKAPGMVGPEDLVSLRRLDRRGRPFWYEVYTGPNLIIFGHTPGRIPRARRTDGRLVALGIDTGCVYGGKLTAYSPELDKIVQVSAKTTYAKR